MKSKIEIIERRINQIREKLRNLRIIRGDALPILKGDKVEFVFSKDDTPKDELEAKLLKELENLEKLKKLLRR